MGTTLKFIFLKGKRIFPYRNARCLLFIGRCLFASKHIDGVKNPADIMDLSNWWKNFFSSHHKQLATIKSPYCLAPWREIHK